MDGLFHSSRQWNVRDKRARKTKAISGPLSLSLSLLWLAGCLPAWMAVRFQKTIVKWYFNWNLMIFTQFLFLILSIALYC